MGTRAALVLCGLYLLCAGWPVESGVAQEPKAPDRSADEKAIRDAITAFRDAFNAGDSKALAPLYAPEASIVDQDGQLYQGREAILAAFGELFRSEPGARIELDVQGIQFFGPGLAIEDGISRVVPKGGPPRLNRYSVTYARRDGGWPIVAVREYPGEAAPARDQVRQLGWMLGEWVDEGDDSVVLTSARLTEDGAYILRDFTIRVRGEVALNGTQRIGWDGASRQFRSWEFDSEGSHGTSLWARDGEGWIVKATATLPDGRVATATHVLAPAGPDRIRWQTRDRTVGDATLPDIREFVLVRRPPTPQAAGSDPPERGGGTRP